MALAAARAYQWEPPGAARIAVAKGVGLRDSRHAALGVTAELD